MIHRNAILETMRSAGVLGDVAADGTGALTRRIGRVLETVRFCGGAELRIDDAGLDDSAPVVLVHLEDFVQTRQHEEHGAFVGERPTRQASPRAARHEGHAERREQPHDGNDFFAGTGKHNEIGNAAVSRKTIHRVGQAFRTRLAHVLLADNCGEVPCESRKHAYILARRVRKRSS